MCGYFPCKKGLRSHADRLLCRVIRGDIPKPFQPTNGTYTSCSENE